ncbi:MAG TPA: LysR family transcriptional regulator [Candidatus Monoglobus merdigallinarum]|uniref:LysR family transcriptional regulator n=1 Tax=Candidatus Monoglobus merdigallinarum TaxID=2838698 RepID=A0A9D1PP48_9FIRM|nr:LysR family transcriptional regulator [Candidatus Monoglobus merdigallinarum]
MELRVLRYFLAVAREQNITAAANSLHISQPTLSRQLMDLEAEFGKALMIRGNRKITLTSDGQLLRKRAKELIALADKTEAEMTYSDTEIGGDIYIGGGEGEAFRAVARLARRIRADYPNIGYHLVSGDADDLRERLDKGLLDFGVFVEPADITKYEFIRLPAAERWGLVMRKDSPLAGKKLIRPEELWELPLIISRQTTYDKTIQKWLKRDLQQLNIAATYNLYYNAGLMAEEGLGYVIGINSLANTSESSKLCFVPLDMDYEIHFDLVWKKYQSFSRAAELFLSRAQESFEL